MTHQRSRVRRKPKNEEKTRGLSADCPENLERPDSLTGMARVLIRQRIVGLGTFLTEVGLLRLWLATPGCPAKGHTAVLEAGSFGFSGSLAYLLLVNLGTAVGSPEPRLSLSQGVSDRGEAYQALHCADAFPYPLNQPRARFGRPLL